MDSYRQLVVEYQPSQPPPPISGVMATNGGLLEIPKGSGELGRWRTSDEEKPITKAEKDAAVAGFKITPLM